MVCNTPVVLRIAGVGGCALALRKLHTANEGRAE
jgi:hypothetical protein